MKTIFSIVCVFFLSMGVSCQKEKSDKVEEMTLTTEEGTSAETQYSNDYLVSIYEAQELIKIDQDNRQMRIRYCEKAYKPDKNLFISMGIGRLHQPDGTPIPQHLAERAAKLDAMRWAAYGAHWLKQDYEPSFGKIQASITQQTEFINKAKVGDSIFVFIGTQIK
jgi:hypothetical protein